jgi:hypothetical protein
MRASLRRRLSFMSGCIAGATAVALDSSGFSGRDAARMGDDETTGSLGRPPAQQTDAALALSDEERSRIYESVMKIANLPTAAAPPPEIAERLSNEVPLEDPPPRVMREVPQLQGHKFVKFDDRILVVDSSTRMVVAMIPRYRLVQ